MAVDGNGYVYVADTLNHRIQKFDSNGVYLTGWGSYGTGSGQFNNPLGVALDGNGNVYVTDTYNHRLQKFDSSGAFLVKWGDYGSPFTQPYRVVVDGSGNLYVTDQGHRVQKFDSDRAYLTSWGSFGSSNSQFNYPLGLTVDSSGKVYVADKGNNRIQIFGMAAPSPEIDVRGNGIAIASGDTTPASADHTDFGAVNVAGGTVVRTFAVHNTGQRHQAYDLHHYLCA